MFEKEAEEIANKRCHEIMCYGHCSFSSPKHHRCGEWHREYNCAKEGIEYGFNKANEWHYVKDGLPSENAMLLLARKTINGVQALIGYYRSNQFEIFNEKSCVMQNIDSVYAWKEIVLPELKGEK